MRLPVRQIAYFVPDIDSAARAHSATFGSGPFFVARHVPLAWSEHRGVRVTHDHSSAYGQWGDVMVEFVMQHGEDRSAFHDMFEDGDYGLHHVAAFVNDLDAAIASFADLGHPLAQISQTVTGTRYAFVDTSHACGHMTELYEPAPALTGFYAMVRRAAQGWDGSEPLRALG